MPRPSERSVSERWYPSKNAKLVTPLLSLPHLGYLASAAWFGLHFGPQWCHVTGSNPKRVTWPPC